MKGAQARKKMRESISKELVSTTEAEDILGVGRQRINVYVQEGRLTPVKRGTFLKDDIYAFRDAFKEARNNGKWLTDFE